MTGQAVDFEGLLGILHGLLGQRVIVTIALKKPPAAWSDHGKLIASFRGELDHAHIEGDQIAFQVGETGSAFFVLDALTLEHATVIELPNLSALHLTIGSATTVVQWGALVEEGQ